MSDYMAKLQSILTPSEEVEEHFIVNGREIVGEYKHIIVEGDENSNTIYITMNDTFDGQQLYPKNIEIRYTTPDGYVGYDKPKITHSGSVIRMAWLLDGNVSRTHGKVEFSIWVTSESYEWKTLSTSFNVEKKQEAFGAEAPPPERDWVRKVIEAANTPADWNQNDETKRDHIKGRIAYECDEILISDELPTAPDDGDSYGLSFRFSRHKSETDEVTFKITSEDKTASVKTTLAGEIYPYTFSALGYDWQYSLRRSGDSVIGFTLFIPEGFSGGQLEVSEIVVHPMDDKYIPDSIARTIQVESICSGLKADMKSIFAFCAISSKVANITVGMSVSGFFPLKFDSWSVSIGEKVIASALGPTDEFVTAPVIFQNEGVRVTFYVGTLLIVTELEIINQHGNTAWGILKFIKFAEEE